MRLKIPFYIRGDTFGHPPQGSHGITTRCQKKVNKFEKVRKQDKSPNYNLLERKTSNLEIHTKKPVPKTTLSQ